MLTKIPVLRFLRNLPADLSTMNLPWLIRRECKPFCLMCIAVGKNWLPRSIPLEAAHSRGLLRCRFSRFGWQIRDIVKHQIVANLTLSPTPTFLMLFLQSIQCISTIRTSFLFLMLAFWDSRTRSTPKFDILSAWLGREILNYVEMTSHFKFRFLGIAALA